MPFASDSASVDEGTRFAPVELNRARALIELLKRREAQRTIEELRRRRERLARQFESQLRSIGRALAGEHEDDDAGASPGNGINDRIGRGTFDP